MKAFRVIGEMEIKRRTWQKFTKEISADDERAAKEKILCDLGSKHKMRRGSIRIKSIEELSKEQISDPVVLYQLGGE